MRTKCAEKTRADYILEKLTDVSGPGLVEAGRYTKGSGLVEAGPYTKGVLLVFPGCI